MTKTAKVESLPECDFCGETALYDAATVFGPWAFMCQSCFDTKSTRQLGLGKGQRLEVVA